MENTIKDYSTYEHRMELSMIDKMFFADKIPNDVAVIVDYGCSNGALLKAIRHIFPSAFLIGYDIDPKMIQNAIENVQDDSIEFFSNWSELTKRLLKIKTLNVLDMKDWNKSKFAIIANSVIHEVYSYGTPEQVREFWSHLFGNHINKSPTFNYICIRDMMVSMAVDRPSDINDVVRVLRKFHRSKPLLDFQANWGTIENNRNLTHFLLKYTYLKPNWEREVKENYLPLYREDFLSLIPSHYMVTFHEHYTLPFLKEGVLKDMGVVLKDPTHIKIILCT